MGPEKKDTKSTFAHYTERSRNVVVVAQEEAHSLEHRYLGTEHLLLGLLRVEDSIAHQALSAFGVTLENTRSQVEHAVGRNVGREGLEPSATGQLPFTPRAKEVLQQAALEARWLEHDKHVGTGHLLLGLSGQYEGVAAKVLKDHDATPGKIRREVMKGTSWGYGQEDSDNAQRYPYDSLVESGDYDEALDVLRVSRKDGEPHIPTDLLPENWSSYYESPTVQTLQKGDSR